MKKVKLFCKTTLALATMLLIGGGDVWGAWTWTGEAHTNGDTDFYLRCAENNTWLGLGYDGTTKVPWAQSDINNAKVFNTAEYTVWPSWTKQSLYFVDGTTKYYLNSTDGNTSYVTSVNDNNTNCQFKEEDSSNRYYRIEVNNSARYFQAGVVNGRVNAPKTKDATVNAKRWQQISAAQMNTYNNRFFYFQANPQVGVGEGSVVAQEEIVYELTNYADRNNTHTQTLTFSATPNVEGGYQFQGWYETEDCSGDCVSTANPFTPSVSNDAAGESAKKTMTLYAKFVAELTPVIEINPGADAMLVGDEVALTDMFTTDHAPSLVYTLEDNDGVLSLTEGTLTALKAGAATIVVTQNAVPGIKYAQAKFTITVSKHANTLAPNQALEFYTTYDNLASLFTTNSDGALTFRLTQDGEEITSITTKNETTFTLYVRQAETEKVYGANKSFALNVQAAAKYAEQTISITKTEGNNSGIEKENVYAVYWENSSNEAGVLSFEVNTTFLASRTLHVFQTLDGSNWTELTIQENKGTLNSKATGVRFAYTGGAAGSATVSNVVVTRRNYLESDVQTINDVNNFEIFYGNIHNVQYELTNISSTNPSAEYTISLSTEDEMNNGEGDYGKYSFAIVATTDVATTLSATAHFFTTENMQLEIPVSLTFDPATLSLVAHNDEGNWATFSSKFNVEFGEGVTVYAVSVEGDNMNLNEVTSKQVPANTGVLVKAASGSVDYTYVASAEELTVENLLKPGAETVTAEANHTYYRLAYDNYDAQTGLGFYYVVYTDESKTAFYSKQGGAYLDVPSTLAPARFIFGQPGVATAVENANLSTAEGKKVMMNGVLYIIRDGKTYDSFGRMVK